MGLLSFLFNWFSRNKRYEKNVSHKRSHRHLISKSYHELARERFILEVEKLEEIESKLWGVKFKHLKNGSKKPIVDDTNLVHLFASNDLDSLNRILEKKNAQKIILKNIKDLKKDFAKYKKEIIERKGLNQKIANYTKKYESEDMIDSLSNVFDLENQLYELVKWQNEELSKVDKIWSTIETNELLGKLVYILKGNMEHQYIWGEERRMLSNASNILGALGKEVKSS